MFPCPRNIRKPGNQRQPWHCFRYGNSAWWVSKMKPIGSDDNHGVPWLIATPTGCYYQRSPSFCLDLSKPLVNHVWKTKKSPSTKSFNTKCFPTHIISWWLCERSHDFLFGRQPSQEKISPPTRPWSSPLLPDILVPIQSQRRIKHHVDPWAMVATSPDPRCGRYTSGQQKQGFFKMALPVDGSWNPKANQRLDVWNPTK